MKNYDPNIRWGTHTVKVSFQIWEYKGYVTYQIRGNCKGSGLLGVDADNLYDTKFLENTADLVIYDDGWFEMCLTDEHGGTIEIEEELRELDDCIIGTEIVDFVEEVAE